MAGGRPKKGIDVLPKEWETQIIALYKQGASDIEIRAMIYDWLNTFSDKLWYRWLDEEPEFLRVIKKGRLLCQAWWEQQGRKSLTAGKLNTALWQINMTNRFGWKHSKEQEKPEDAADQLKVIANEIGKSDTGSD